MHRSGFRKRLVHTTIATTFMFHSPQFCVCTPWVSTMDPKSASNEEVYNGGKLIEAAAASPFD